MPNTQIPLWTPKDRETLEAQIQNETPPEYRPTHYAETPPTMPGETQTKVEVARRIRDHRTQLIEAKFHGFQTK